MKSCYILEYDNRIIEIYKLVTDMSHYWCVVGILWAN